MTNLNALPPFDALRRAVLQAWPQMVEIASIQFEGTYPQAWEMFARLLGIDETALADKVAPAFNIEPAGRLDAVESPALAELPSSFCQTHGVIPLRIEKGWLVVATANPNDEEVRERLRFMVNRPVRWVLASPNVIGDVIVVAYSRDAARLAVAANESASDPSGDDNAVIQLGRGLLVNSVNARASDLHIQPFMGATVVRIRVDGALRRLAMLPDSVGTTLIRHFKARSGMDSTNSLVPQDGRMSMVVEGRDFDLRVSTLPASRGERMVIRLLDQNRVHRLGNAKFSLAALQAIRRAIARPSGMVIMTGPTGSGKTSTLYAMLGELNRSTVNIITVENPVEYRIPGISQVDVNDRAGRTFQAALRSILRQDPDVVLIGEIRDHETAEIATQAALTGHLVLSTLHTNDAMTAVPRLLNLGISPSVLADSLSVVVSQRLVRTLCPTCKVPVVEPLTPEEGLFRRLTGSAPSHRPLGCKECDFTGYSGRVPVVEILEMNTRLRDAIATGESRLEALDALRDGGLRSLAVSGGHRIISGDTTVREVIETAGPGFWHEIAHHFGRTVESEDLAFDLVGTSAAISILLISGDPTLAGMIDEVVAEQGYKLVTCASREDGIEILHRDESIGIIIGDLGDGLDFDEAVSRLREGRVIVAWTRLPTLVLLPPSLAHQEEALRASGSLATFLPKPLSAEQLVRFLRQCAAR